MLTSVNNIETAGLKYTSAFRSTSVTPKQALQVVNDPHNNVSKYRSHHFGVIRVDAINHMYTQECLIGDYQSLHNAIVQNERLFVLT